MDHTPLHRLKEKWLGRGVGPLRRDDGVDGIWDKETWVALQKGEEMHVRQSALLKLDGINIRRPFTKDAILVDLLDDELLLQLEATGYQIWSIIRSLAAKQRIHYFTPQ
jgi:hypothetical protein